MVCRRVVWTRAIDDWCGKSQKIFLSRWFFLMPSVVFEAKIELADSLLSSDGLSLKRMPSERAL